MRKIQPFLIVSIVLLVLTISFISAARLPTINGDSDSWGSVLNEYLIKLAGENATALNSTMINAGNINFSSINSTHILDSTITDEDISDSTNLTANWFLGNLNWSYVQNAPTSDWISTYNVTYNNWAYNQTTPAVNSILSFNYYNSSSFIIGDYYLKSNPYSFYNSTSLTTLSQLSNDLGIGNWTADKNNYYTLTQIENNLTNYYTKSQIENNLTNYYNSTQTESAISNANTSVKNYADSTFIRKTGDNGTGQYNFGGSWTEGGVTINSGSVYAQTIYVYNVTSLGVNNLNINGSLLPPSGYDNTFDIGSGALRWRDSYFSRNVYVNGSIYGNIYGSWNGSVNHYTISQIENNFTNYYTSTQTDNTFYLKSNPYLFYNSTNINSLISGNSGYLALFNGTSSLNNSAIYQSGSNVGIGTTSPGAKLEIYAGASDVLAENIRFSRGDAYRYNSIYSYSNDGGNAYLQFRVHDGVGDATQATVMTLKGTGYVGIGTTSPSQKLDVNGSIAMTSTSPILTGVRRIVANSQDFGINNNANNVTNLFIQDTGNVGIGTTSPANQLDIRGSEYVSGYIVGFDVNPNGNYAYRLTNDGTNSFINTLGGNLGIGTTSPQGLIDITIPYSKTDTTNRVYAYLGKSNDTTNYAALQLGMTGGASAGVRAWMFQTIEQGVANNGYLTLQPYGGSVGIGTITPNIASSDKALTMSAVNPFLEFNSTGGSHAQIRFYSANVYKGGLLKDSNDNIMLASSSGKNLNFSVDSGSTSAVVITSAGNVGIGTAGPRARLDVDGDIMMTGNAVIRTIWNGGYGGAIQLLRSDVDTTRWSRIGIVSDPGTWLGGLTIQSDIDAIFDGNVGIGTTSPKGKLQIGTQVSLDEPAAGQTSLTKNLYFDGANWKYIATDEGAALEMEADGSINFYTASSGTAGNIAAVNATTNRLKITNTGDVGIGTTSPVSRLTLKSPSSYAEPMSWQDSNGVVRGYLYGDTDGYGGIFSVVGATGEGMLWSSSLGRLWLYANSTQAMTILGSGNVGIGTTTPGYKLHVQGGDFYVNDTSDVYAIIKSNAADSYAFLAIANDARQYTLMTDGAQSDNFKIRDSTAGQDRLVLDSSGNIGIGTTSPYAKFQVAGGATTEPSLTHGTAATISIIGNDDSVALSGGQSVNSPYPFWLQVKHDTVDAAYPLSLQPLGGNVGIGTTNPTRLLSIESGTNTVMKFRETSGTPTNWTIGVVTSGNFIINDESNDTQRLVIDGNGYVGIGTTNPGYSLDVQGNAGGITINTNGAILVGSQVISGAGSFASSSNSIDVVLQSGATTLATFKTSGNVGIGTTSPGAKLEVNGSEIVKGLALVDSSNNGEGPGTFQQISGTKTAGSSGVATGVLRCDHTAAGRIYIIARQSTGNVASADFDFTVAYGAGDATRQRINTVGAVTDINATYNNGGAPYQIDVTVTYTGAAPTIYWAAEGIGNSNWYAL